MYCVPLKGVFDTFEGPEYCGVGIWYAIGAPQRPQKRLPAARGPPQEGQLLLVINLVRWINEILQV